METAVEYLIRHSGELYTSKKWQEIFEKAKQMEKEQIMEAYWDGYIKPYSQEMITEAEQYYNETYEQS
jgi:HEPN domain-containing protein